MAVSPPRGMPTSSAIVVRTVAITTGSLSTGLTSVLFPRSFLSSSRYGVELTEADDSVRSVGAKRLITSFKVGKSLKDEARQIQSQFVLHTARNSDGDLGLDTEIGESDV